MVRRGRRTIAALQLVELLVLAVTGCATVTVTALEGWGTDTAAHSPQGEELRELLQMHAPQKLGKMKKMLRKWRGREDYLLDKMRAKYGVVDYASQLRELFENFKPKMLGNLPRYLDKWAGHEKQLYEKVQKQFIPGIDQYPMSEEEKASESRQTRRTDPSALLARLFRSEPAPLQMRVRLLSQTKPEVPHTAAADEYEDVDYEEALTTLFGEFAPEKLGKVPVLLRKYKGSEKRLLRVVRDKYGVDADDADADAEGVPNGPQAWMLEKFASDAECDFIVRHYADALVPCMPPSRRCDENNARALHYRDEHGNMTRKTEATRYHQVLALLTERADAMLQPHVGYIAAEGIPQVVCYQPGGEFGWHYDEYVNEANIEVCYSATLMLYMNDVEEGGETHFVDSPRATNGPPTLNVRPKKGDALLWLSCLPGTTTRDDKAHHSGTPVRRGDKWILNFFYGGESNPKPVPADWKPMVPEGLEYFNLGSTAVPLSRRDL